MLDTLVKINRKLRLDHKNLRNSMVFDEEICKIVDKFLDQYCAFNSISVEDVLQSHQAFSQEYSNELGKFKSSRLYPFQRDGVINDIDREKYDVVLILSILVSPVRHKIMKKIKSLTHSLAGKIGLIGVGAGIDLEIIQKNKRKNLIIDAFDISLNKFVSNYFSGVRLYEEAFKYESKIYDTLFAIELLEHLEDPMDLVRKCSQSLDVGGRFVFTTATDMPQFDHVFNFNNDREFARELEVVGLKIVSKVDLFHDYVGGPETAKNTWYECEKI